MKVDHICERGFCYVANTHAYLAEALTSIASLKKVMPEYRVCVIAPKELQDPKLFLIDDWREPKITDRTPIVKNDATLAPYRRVAFVDTDTRFLLPMDDVFDVLDSFDIAAAHEPTRGWDYVPDPGSGAERLLSREPDPNKHVLNPVSGTQFHKKH